MKITSSDAVVIARILERYYVYASGFMSRGFSTHPETLCNSNLFLETAEDLNIVANIYPAFSGGKSIQDGVAQRTNESQLPDPKKPLTFTAPPELIEGPAYDEGER